MNCSVNLDLTLYIEGYYLGGGFMRAVANPISFPFICDTIHVSLANSISPFSIQGSVQGTINTSGNGTFIFPAVPPANYYIVAKHRSSLETWSSVPIASSPSMSYDFSTSASKAYGNNQKSMGDGNFALISGDINQDAIIDINDEYLLELSIQNINSGYFSSDLNGDWLTESSDFSLLENNVGIYSTQKP